MTKTVDDFIVDCLSESKEKFLLATEVFKFSRSKGSKQCYDSFRRRLDFLSIIPNSNPNKLERIRNANGVFTYRLKTIKKEAPVLHYKKVETPKARILNLLEQLKQEIQKL